VCSIPSPLLREMRRVVGQSSHILVVMMGDAGGRVQTFVSSHEWLRRGVCIGYCFCQNIIIHPTRNVYVFFYRASESKQVLFALFGRRL
jgi:hypothetical protein